LDHQGIDFSVVHDDQLLNFFNAHQWQIQNLNEPNQHFAAMQGMTGQYGLRHAGRHHHRPVYSLLTRFQDFVRGKFLSWFYQKTIGSLSRLKWRFFFINKEKDYLKDSEILAKGVFIKQ